ncbi:chondroitinase-B domain-containing protein [Vibrio sp. TH_r3]|uniref:chondroitinase-B domain-containing protein n=1 Tax=Vibrio sp. TH_r3 TaxID=3082084 RepID=UPI0029532E0A|nr:chondroitinase-B domain-containing protein [Vibrio sp. TH_r3]MDV7102926.1 chondroitinase-B domain-containing protein [Vibrio sp. TH_r3]
MGVLNKIVTKYLLLSGIIFNLGLGVAGYYATQAIVAKGSLPGFLKLAAQKLDKPIIKPIAATLQSASDALYSPIYYSQPFNAQDWPTVGPNFSLHHSLVGSTSRLFVSNSKQLAQAIKSALPGTSIIIKDGDYQLSGKRINVSKTTPTRTRPIRLMAQNPGKVNISMNSNEGLYLSQPYWLISGLRFIGDCGGNCEHAMHIVGNAHSIEISHNEFIDYNAAIKVNGTKNKYPDSGLVTHNHFYANAPRNTSSSVTPINIDHANDWIVSHNIIRDFVKTGGNKVSYGAYIKGGANGGYFENNLVICNSSQTQYPSSSVGLSVGGGGMKSRRNNAPYEAENITIRNNLIIHCSDVGIYINRGKNATINNNTLYNTMGLDLRFPQTSANVINNVIGGKLRLRDNSTAMLSEGNLILARGFIRNDEPLGAIFTAPETEDFSINADHSDLNKHAVSFPSSDKPSLVDFCSQEITDRQTFIGAFDSTVTDSKPCFPFADAN